MSPRSSGTCTPGFRATLLILLGLLTLPPAALAQDTRGDLQGRVLDMAGTPIAEVDVVLRGSELPGAQAVTTDRQGFFRVARLPVGAYSIELRRLGYQTVMIGDVTVRLGRTTAIGDMRMPTAPVELETLQASVEPLLIDPVSTAGGVNLTPELYENLPLARDYQMIVTLVPQANESYLGDGLSVAGGTGPENKFFIEGVEVTDPLMGFESTRLPYNFIREIEVKTGGYEAEYRSSLGGITNVVTYSGGNEFTGQLFGFYASDQLGGSARLGPSELTKKDAAAFDVGGMLGGPIVRDQLWFFSAYNPFVQQETVTVTGQGQHEDRTVQHRYATKLTWRPTPGSDIYFTAFGDPGSRDAVTPISGTAASMSLGNPDPWLTERDFGGHNLLIGGTQLLNSKGLLDGSFSFISRRNRIQPATEEGFETNFQDISTSTLSGGVVHRVDASMWRVAARLKTTWDLGQHSLKGGVEYYESRYEAKENHRYFVRKFTDDSYVEGLVDLPGSVRSRNPAAFVQDSWSVSETLRLNAGLRWEAQHFVRSDGVVAQSITDQFQPRLGFVWQPGRLGSQRVYGSVGRFYQDVALSLAAGYFNPDQTYRWTGFDHDPRVDQTGGDVLFEDVGSVLRETAGLRGQSYDEMSLGYERQFGRQLKAGARGVYRRLNDAVEDAVVDLDEDIWAVGNPGSGDFAFLPRAEREYFALELTAEGQLGERLRLVGSYVLSRVEGNYGGLFMADYGEMIPNTDPSFDIGEEVISDGLLPQDRTHSLKLAASYAAPIGFTVGGRLLWQTGTPLSVLGGSTHPPHYAFSEPRGSGGRTPSIWDLDLRFAYDFARQRGRLSQVRLILDVFNIGSPRKAVDIDQIAFFNLDDAGDPTDPNPFYGEPVRYQPPMAVRLGMEVGF